jgi:rod shape-determining protein MreD
VLADPRFKLPVAFLVLVVLHTTLLPQVRIAGVMPDVMLLAAVAGGLVGGPLYGAALGFASGMVADLFLTTPLGLSALVFSLVGYAIGVAKGGLLRSAWWFTFLTALLASAGGEGLFALAGAMLGEGDLLRARLLVIMAVVGVTNAVLAPWVVRLVRWALQGHLPRGAFAR